MTDSSDYIPVFQSVLAQHLEGHLKGKRAGGYRYQAGAFYLEKFDQFLTLGGHDRLELPKDLLERWIAKRKSESSKTHINRVVIIRQFTKYLLRQGVPAYVPPPGRTPVGQNTFVPHIFTNEEIRRFLTEIDIMPPSPCSLRRHLVMPELFRLLIFCGLRVSEVQSLRVKDVDLESGVLSIRQSKFGKDRLVPLAGSITKRLRIFAERLGVRNGEAPFFPSRHDVEYSKTAIYPIFRNILKRIGIEHKGRGFGPRLHDLRHTFAVHRMLSWYQEGADINAKLPILATYLGHQGMNGTQRYLHLVPELFPEVTTLLEKSVGHIIPGKEMP